MNRWARRILWILGAVAILVTAQPFVSLLLAPPSPEQQQQQHQNQQEENNYNTPISLHPLPAKDTSNGNKKAEWRPITSLVKLPQLDEDEEIKAEFTPECDKGNECLLDIWRETEKRVVFMTRSSRPLACKFRAYKGAKDYDTSPTSSHHSANLGEYIFSCLVPDHFLSNSSDNFNEGTQVTVEIANREVKLPSWLRSRQRRRFNLSAVIMFRIFKEDLFNITFLELQEWLEAMFYAGIEHVYMYDNYVDEKESQIRNLAPYIKAGLVTYHPWPLKKPYGYPVSQQSSYTHCLYRYKTESEWQWQSDVDEYPLVFGDIEEGYLLRLAKKISAKNSEITQIHLQSVFFGEEQTSRKEDTSCNDRCEKRCKRPLLIERYRHRENPPKSSLRIKPIFKPAAMQHANVHRMSGSGSTVEVGFNQAWLLHYWGFRCKDCPFKDDVAQPLAAQIRARLRVRDCGNAAD